MLSQLQAHDEFEDTDIINYLLDFQGDLNIQTRLVSWDFLNAVRGLYMLAKNETPSKKLQHLKLLGLVSILSVLSSSRSLVFRPNKED